MEWCKFEVELPIKEKEYVVIVKRTHSVMTLTYYPEVQKFNYDGNGKDTSIEVEFWAEKEDIFPTELKRI